MNFCLDCAHFDEDYMPGSGGDSGWHDRFCRHPEVITMDFITGAALAPDPWQVRGAAEHCAKFQRRRGLAEQALLLFKRSRRREPSAGERT